MLKRFSFSLQGAFLHFASKGKLRMGHVTLPLATASHCIQLLNISLDTQHAVIVTFYWLINPHEKPLHKKTSLTSTRGILYHPQRLTDRQTQTQCKRLGRTVCSWVNVTVGETVQLLSRSVHSLSAEPLKTLTRWWWDEWICSHPCKFAFRVPIFFFFFYILFLHMVFFFCWWAVVRLSVGRSRSAPCPTERKPGAASERGSGDAFIFCRTIKSRSSETHEIDEKG